MNGTTRVGYVLWMAFCLCFAMVADVRANATNGGIVYTSYGETNDTSGKNPPVVLIHGWSCDGSVWNLQVPTLAKHGRVVVLDLLGHGRSIKPHVEYTLERFAEGVLGVMDKESIDRAVLVGHSMGFAVARMVALQQPRRCIALCSVDGVFQPLPPNPEKNPEKLARRRKLVSSFTTPFQADDAERYAHARMFVNSLFVPATPERLRRRIRGMMLATPRYVGDSAMRTMFREEDWLSRPMPDLPVLVVNSGLFGISDELRGQLLREYPQARCHVLPGTGHFLMLERPAPVNRLLLDFLGSLPAQ